MTSTNHPFVIPAHRTGIATDPEELVFFREFLDTPEIHPPCDTRLRRTIDGEIHIPDGIDQAYLREVRIYRAAMHLLERRR